MTNAATRFQPDISGSAVPTGFIGEYKYDSGTGIIDIYASIGNWTTSTDVSVSLTKGTWLINYSTGFYWINGTGSAVFTIKFGVIDDANAEIDLCFNGSYGITNSTQILNRSRSFMYNINSDKILRISGYAAISSGSVTSAPTIQVRNDSGALQWGIGSILALRIA